MGVRSSSTEYFLQVIGYIFVLCTKLHSLRLRLRSWSTFVKYQNIYASINILIFDSLYIQILNKLGVFFDEFASWFYFVAHEGGEGEV